MKPWIPSYSLGVWLILTLVSTIGFVSMFRPTGAYAQEQGSTTNLHLQTTMVSQKHGGLNSPYMGANSLTPSDDNQTSLTFTVYAGQRLWRGGQFFINPELAGGSGFNKTTGIAGFPNGEIYRVDDPAPKWTLARMFYKQNFSFGGEQEQFKDDKNQLAEKVDVRRLTFIVGKIALNDYFDANTYSHDPRTQFLNWALMDNAAWDYAADTRGYSWGLYLEYNEPSWTLRVASVLVPKVANQLEMELNYPQFRGDEFEYEYRYKISDHHGALRTLVYRNTTNGGNYRAAINNGSATNSTPDITAMRSMSTKTGFGLNLEQSLTPDLGAFARVGWNDGENETWAFTEVDRAFSLGLSLTGARWSRPHDTVGLALVLNALSNEHRDYLAAGGVGFIIGDSKLSYGLEQIGELYYLYKVKEGLDFTGDYQFVRNPAFNTDRGPVSILSMRVHYEI